MSEENRIITQMYEQMMTAKYPIPNPAWEYSAIYHRVQEIRKSLNNLVNFMGEIKNPTTETDKSIREYLDQIGQQLNSTRKMLDEQEES